MIESMLSPKFGGGNRQFLYSECFPLSQNDYHHNAPVNNYPAPYSTPNEACLPTQNGFYGPNMGAGHSDCTVASSPENFTFSNPNPPLPGPAAPGMSSSHCINGLEPAPHYPTIVSNISLLN